VYTARAVHRYTIWWSIGLPRSRQMATINDLEYVGYENIVKCDTLVAWSPDNLPPLGTCFEVPKIIINTNIAQIF
jgi:hypothetical protein